MLADGILLEMVFDSTFMIRHPFVSKAVLVEEFHIDMGWRLRNRDVDDRC